MTAIHQTDILIIGAGIAGLWLNARLRQLGYATVLIDQAPLGSGQSGKSQGIIHGGIKYALHGSLTGSSEAIAEMPQRWRQALSGEGELDLQGVRILSEAHYLWSPGTLTGNLASFFASKAVRGRADPVQGRDLPPALQHPDFRGRVYRLAELVLDVPSLIRHLGSLAGDSLLQSSQLQLLGQGQQVQGCRTEALEIQARRTVLCAGQGNAGLLAQLGLQQPAMQTRPLHMVMVTAPGLQPLYAHCMGAGTKPRVTITSHPRPDGQLVWYLGGELAESAGVARSPEQQIAAARHELRQLLPWLDLDEAQWDTLRIDRAEPAQSTLVRPENAFLFSQDKLMVAWPTKLALAPDLADRVLQALQADNIRPQATAPLPEHPQPVQAPPFWEALA